MTPLLDFMITGPLIRQNWRPDISGIVSFDAFLRQVASGALYVVDRAEQETTALYAAEPDYMACCDGVRLPKDPTWIEFDMYASPGVVVGRRAFLSTMVDDGRLMAFDVAAPLDKPIVQIVPAFAIDSCCIGTGWNMDRKGIRVALCDLWAGLASQSDATHPRFLAELLQMINLDRGVSRRTLPVASATRRSLQRVLGHGAAISQAVEMTLEPQVEARAPIHPFDIGQPVTEARH